jgi:hypothetical protein
MPINFFQPQKWGCHVFGKFLSKAFQKHVASPISLTIKKLQLTFEKLKMVG